ncbi:hypothetical protein ACE193_23640 [Bernardetia sp. OM2101]|uniref:hypothetical protein n=1 Tax=Bernardetia sp. OM2101 TaxID=3344876 RepID=UPI0035D0072C
MESINITFQHGHIYNSKTKERIVLEENVNYVLFFEKESDMKIGSFDKPTKIRSAAEICDELKLDANVTHIKKLKSAGSYLYFFIKEKNENKEEGVRKQSCFRITLLEDLFLYTSSKWKNKDSREGGMLADCACVVDESKDDELPFFERIYAKSVTSVCKMTHIHYFGNAGSPSKNSFDSVYLFDMKSKSYLLKTLRGFTDEDRV